MKYFNLAVVVTASILLMGASVFLGKHVNPPITTNTVDTVTLSPRTTTNTVSPTVVPNKKVLSVKVPEDQVIVLSGEIGGNSLALAEQITAKAQKGLPLYLLISSPGGSVTDGSFVINAIEASPVPVYTVCVDLCASMAAIIHQYGTKRLMMDRSVLMFHDAAGGFQGYFPHIKSLYSTMERYIARFNAHIAKRSNMTQHDLEEAEHVQLWVDAEDAQGTFSDGITFIQVVDSKLKPADLTLLLQRNKQPSINSDQSKSRKLFELYWITQ